MVNHINSRVRVHFPVHAHSFCYLLCITYHEFLSETSVSISACSIPPLGYLFQYPKATVILHPSKLPVLCSLIVSPSSTYLVIQRETQEASSHPLLSSSFSLAKLLPNDVNLFMNYLLIQSTLFFHLSGHPSGLRSQDYCSCLLNATRHPAILTTPQSVSNITLKANFAKGKYDYVTS